MCTNVRKEGIVKMEKIFPLVSSDRKIDNWPRLKCRKFYLNVRKTFFTVRLVERWNKIIGEAVKSLSWR